MTYETYAIVAGAIDAAVGMSLGFGFGLCKTSTWVIVLGSSLAVAFLCLSSFVVGYEVVYGEGAAAGLAWALMYFPANLGLSVGSLVFCLLGTILRMGIARLSKR